MMSHQSPASTTNNMQQVTRKRRRGMIEKKRRDKINNSLGELRRLVPAAFEKQGSSKLEKAEILQMTVDYLRLLHNNGLADILISKSSKLEQVTSAPSHTSQPAVAPLIPASITSSASTTANTTIASHTQMALSQHHHTASMVQAASYQSGQQHGAVCHRVSPHATEHQSFSGNLGQVNYHHADPHMTAAAAAASRMYQGYQEHLPSYYYS